VKDVLHCKLFQVQEAEDNIVLETRDQSFK